YSCKQNKGQLNGQRVVRPVWNNTRKANSSRAVVLVNTSKPVNTAYSRPTMNSARTMSNVFNRAHSPDRRPFNKFTANKDNNFNEKVNTVRGNITTAGPRAVVSDDRGNQGNPQLELQEKGIIDSGCSRHMTGNLYYLFEYEEIDGGYVAFGGDPKGGKITGKGKIGRDTKCVVLSPDFKLLDESQVLLRVLRKNNMYIVNLKNVALSGATKDETSGILKVFITGIENLIDHKVKIIKCDNRTEFKNNEMNQSCEKQGIKREFSVARTPPQNGVAEKSKTLIEAARTMLADSKLPTTFWAKAFNTACYVQNKVLVIKPHNKTPYELFHGRTSSLSFMRPFGCPVIILNTVDPLGKFDGEDNEGFFVRYSVNSKAFRVFNSRTRIVEEIAHYFS
nr:ribonuclease H-like domain-containing protein [Tanacetum cinerariifolium]